MKHITMELAKYVKTRFNALKRQLRNYTKSPEVETLHKIRVEIKKIKMIFKLVDSCVKKFKFHRNYLPLRMIFRKAGRIREPELIYGLLLRYEIAGIHDGLIPQSLVADSLSKEFIERIPSFIRTIDESKRAVEKYLGKIHNDEVSRYVKRKRKEVRSLLCAKWNRGTLHKARKVIKEINYLSVITERTKKDLDPFYKDMEKLIGQWHDKQVLVPLLKADNSSDLNRIKSVSRSERTKLKKLALDFFDHP